MSFGDITVTRNIEITTKIIAITLIGYGNNIIN
jgi:hypothetical protein